MTLLFKIEKEATPDIPGVTYISDFMTRNEEDLLIAEIDNQPWLNTFKRRVQHYGYKYDYKARTVPKEAYLGALPNWLQLLAQKLYDESLFQTAPDQVIINEYLPGQGISAHIDCTPCFGEIIASLTLGSGAVMQFRKENHKYEMYLEPLSLIVLSGPARYEWQHAIPARKSDKVAGIKVDRARRISLTFRTILM